jgi:isocitrate dehydrogenase
MEATLHVLLEAGACISIEPIEIGEKVYLRGHLAGIEPGGWESIRRTRVFLKAPITTPQGGGFRSLNVTTRKMLGLYANVRPCVAYHPYVSTRHPGMNVVIVRENEEDLYAGIEHRQTDQVYQCLRIITRPGSERIIRYAFEYARAYGRKKVACFTKDNIMRLTDGLFHKVFDEVAAEYPGIRREHWIVDIGAARLSGEPNDFDVVVMPNLYGDILSDVAAQMAGSVGLAGSANIGAGCGMFEAIHGSAPRRAGQDLANPSGLLLAAIMMMVHIGQPDVAARIHNAWLKTIEDGVHTHDIYRHGRSRQKAGTREFARAVAARLGHQPHHLTPVAYSTAPRKESPLVPVHRQPQKKQLVGVDVFLDWNNGLPGDLGPMMEKLAGEHMNLIMVSNRGVKVYPQGIPDTVTCDNWRCRFMSRIVGQPVTHRQIIDLLERVSAAGFDFIKTEGLYTFDGQAGFTLSQGQ